MCVFGLAEPNNESPLNVEAAQLWDNKTGLQLVNSKNYCNVNPLYIEYKTKLMHKYKEATKNGI